MTELEDLPQVDLIIYAGGALMEVRKTRIETPDYKKAEVLQCLFIKFLGPNVS